MTAPEARLPLELVDQVASAMAGWPMSTACAEDAAAWRANATTALTIAERARQDRFTLGGSRSSRLYGTIRELLGKDVKSETISEIIRAAADAYTGPGDDRVVAVIPVDTHIGDVNAVIEALSDTEWLWVRGAEDGSIEVWARG